MTKFALTVDDSVTMRQMIAFTLKDAGFEVLEAGDGQEAIDLLAKNDKKISLIITDLNMPKVDGIEFIKYLRANSDYKFTPILMLTTESDDAKKAEGKQAGATGWIVKPFKPEKLIEVVKKVCP